MKPYGASGVSLVQGFSLKHLALTAFVFAVIGGGIGAAGMWLYVKPDRDAYTEIKQVMPRDDVSISEIIARLSLDSQTSKKLAEFYKAPVNGAAPDMSILKERAELLSNFILHALKQQDPTQWMLTVADNAPYAANNFSKIEEFKKLSDEQISILIKYYGEFPDAVKFLKSMNSVPIGKFSEQEFLFAAHILRILKNHGDGIFVNYPNIEFITKFIVWVAENPYRSNSVQDLIDSKYTSAIKEIQILQKADKKK